MRPRGRSPAALVLALITFSAWCAPARADEAGSGASSDVLQRLDQRFATPNPQEDPDFQRHVIPLIGRLGCNGRACHGSFQGKGGFRLSLFGYDFAFDQKALTEETGDEGEVRVNKDNPDESLIIKKPTNADLHEGGQRYEKGSWEYNVLRRWIETGAKFAEEDITRLERLDISPPEIVFERQGQEVQLQVVAVWADGSKEDVTPLCRFQTNNEQTAAITKDGLVTAGDPGDTHVVIFYDKAVVPVPVMRPVSDLVGDKFPKVPTPTRIDELVMQKLRKVGVVPSEVCTDADFLRRVKLDLTGTLPTPQEVEQFLADSSAGKRAQKVEELLQSPAYAAWWTTRLCDYTGNNDNELRNAVPIRGKASQDWYDWLYKRVSENMPYDQLAEGIILAQSRNEGESYLDYCKNMSDVYRGDASFADRECMPYYWARNNFRMKEDRVIGFAYSFLGVRIQCAQCHKHPFDQWTKSDFEQFTGFFTRVSAQNRGTTPEAKREYDEMIEKLGIKGKKGNNEIQKALAEALKDGETIPFPETYVVAPKTVPKNRQGKKPAEAPADKARLLGAEEAINLNDYEDPREPLMDWMRSPENPYFAKAFVNRVWSNYFNVGIVEPPDDLSLANPPSNAPLLDYLAKGFIEHGFDMKWVHREIINSDTYQRSWVVNETNQGDTRNFARAVPRRVPAEVAYDSLVQATGSDDAIAKMQDSVEGRAIALAGSSPRYNGGNTGPNFALSVFGRSIRESNCDCDRSMEPSLLQTVFLQNDQEVLRLIDRGDGWISQLGGKERVESREDDKSDAKADEVKEKQFAAIKARIKKLRKDGNDEAADRLEKRLAEFKSRGGKRGDEASSEASAESAESAESTKSPAPPKPADAKALVEQAYLRTVSRLPSESELARSQEFIASYENPIEGVRGVLWALLNTKEFIVNH